MRTGRPKTDAVARFWESMPPLGDGCWEWQGDKFTNGYGRFWMDGKCLKAHRVMLQGSNVRVEPTDVICHHCDNRACVRPDHLYVGSHKTNAGDRQSRGRGRKQNGELNHSAKLTEESVRGILGAVGLHREIAERFGVSRELVSQIKRRVIWRHVE